MAVAAQLEQERKEHESLELLWGQIEQNQAALRERLLLKIVVGELPPDAGTVTWGYEASPGYFSQDHSELSSGGKQSVESWLLEAAPGERTVGGDSIRRVQVTWHDRFRIERQGPMAVGTADPTLAWAFVNVHYVGQVKGRPVALPMRLFVVLAREDGAWRAVHLHYSNAALSSPSADRSPPAAGGPPGTAGDKPSGQGRASQNVDPFGP